MDTFGDEKCSILGDWRCIGCHGYFIACFKRDVRWMLFFRYPCGRVPWLLMRGRRANASIFPFARAPQIAQVRALFVVHGGMEKMRRARRARNGGETMVEMV